MRSKMAQQLRESGDVALAAVYGTVSVPYKPLLHYAYYFLKENNSAINRLPLGLYALFYRIPAKIMLPPQAQTVQYRFLRRSRRLYGNHKSPLSCRSSGSLQNIFETTWAIGTIRTTIWKPGFRIWSTKTQKN